MSSIFFEEFTGKYSLPKTLRFELRQVFNTEQMLQDENVFEKDEKIERAYQKTKPLFDQLHREFVAEALGQRNLDPKAFKEFYTEYRDIITVDDVDDGV